MITAKEASELSGPFQYTKLLAWIDGAIKKSATDGKYDMQMDITASQVKKYDEDLTERLEGLGYTIEKGWRNPYIHVWTIKWPKL